MAAAARTAPRRGRGGPVRGRVRGRPPPSHLDQEQQLVSEFRPVPAGQFREARTNGTSLDDRIDASTCGKGVDRAGPHVSGEIAAPARGREAADRGGCRRGTGRLDGTAAKGAPDGRAESPAESTTVPTADPAREPPRHDS
ncbi:hypothetical protein E6R62_24930 [Streptomyces sp. A1136]|nr:hypothetical protein E6R62_24930 [Streptomyces sp. A1136]